MLGGCPEFGRLEPLVSTLVSKTQIELRANFLELVMVPFPELDLEPGSKHKVWVELEPKPKIYEKKKNLWILQVFD
jgi:hypothetical protein